MMVNRNVIGWLLTMGILPTLSMLLPCCGDKKTQNIEIATEVKQFPDTLRVGTIYGPTSYFIYREKTMGYDYELLESIAAEKGCEIEIEIAPNINSLVEMLDSGVIDLAACGIPITGEFKSKVIPCGPEQITTQMLVQSKNAVEKIKDVTELVGKEIYVEAGSKYFYRLQNLNDELGGGITLIAIDSDTISTEDLMEMVSDGDIDLTVVDSDIAKFNKSYYKNLDITLEISFPQRSAWGVAPGNEWLGEKIDQWFTESSPKEIQSNLLKRYFELSKRDEDAGIYRLDLMSGKISPFDSLFRRYAGEIGWDWRLMASQGYQESRYDSTLVSWAGAKGVMQIMPGTAKAQGLSADRITNNDANIETAAKIIVSLDSSLADKIEDKEERYKFIVAAYNSGLAHILDAIALAKKHGMNPEKWEGNVANALLMKSKPEYYNDPVCKFGYFSGKQTVEYVKNVFSFYDRVKKKIKL